MPRLSFTLPLFSFFLSVSPTEPAPSLWPLGQLNETALVLWIPLGAGICLLLPFYPDPTPFLFFSVRMVFCGDPSAASP